MAVLPGTPPYGGRRHRGPAPQPTRPRPIELPPVRYTPDVAPIVPLPRPELPPVAWVPELVPRPGPRRPSPLLPPPPRVFPRPPMIPCPRPVPCPGPPPTFSAPPRGVEPICPAPFGAHEEATMKNHCPPRPCPPAPSPARPLPPSGCVAVPHGNTRGGIFDAPWVGGTFMDAARMTVPTNCPPGSGQPLPGVATGPRPRFSPSPYGDPQIVPAPCPPPCQPRPCPPRPRPERPPTYTPTPTPVTPERPPTYTPTPVTPGRPPTFTPTPITPGRPPMTTPTPPWLKPKPIPPSTTPGREPVYDKIRPKLPVPPPVRQPPPMSRPRCEPGWTYSAASGRCEPPALKGFGGPFVPSANTSGIFDIPRCNTAPGVPYAGSPYSDPTIMPAPCPPRPCPPPPCGPGSGQERRPRIIVPPTQECPERRPRRICPPERFPVVPPPEPCAGFGAGPDGLGFWR